MSLWDTVLPVVQAINDDGGNFTSFFLNRSVIELLDQAATAGDPAAATSRERIVRAVGQGKWPHDPNAFNAIFENYHEPVPGVLYDPAAMLPDFRIDQLAEMRLQPFVRPILIRSHQARVPRHIGGEDRGEAADRGHDFGAG